MGFFSNLFAELFMESKAWRGSEDAASGMERPGQEGPLAEEPGTSERRPGAESYVAPKGEAWPEDQAPSVRWSERGAPASASPSSAGAGSAGPGSARPPSTRGPLHPLDDALLQTLERAFELHSGPDQLLDEVELQRALGYRNPLLARRLLRVLDRDGDGVVTRAEFVERIRRLLYGSATEKLRFAFHIHDLDGDGKLEPAELLTMIEAGMVEERTFEGREGPLQLVELVLAEADRNADGRLSYAEFAGALERYPEVLEMITRCEAQWIAPNADILARRPLQRTWSHRLARTLANKGASLVVLGVWGLAQVWLSLRAYRIYQDENGFYILARMAGACLNFNGALILLPVLRRLLTEIRQTPLLRRLPVDDALAFHRLVGHTMFGWGLVHTAGHLGNYRATVGITSGVFQSHAGLTGYFLLLVATWMWITSWPIVRRTRHFELFYFSHLLYVAWLGLAWFHAPNFKLWLTVPIVGLVVDKLFAFRSRARRSRVLEIEPMRSEVTRLELARPPGFRFQAGDYAFLNLPALARHEWHPFTISSAPEREHLTMHVRSLGNFTRSLHQLALAREALQGEELVVRLDGPHGSPSGKIFESRVPVLIGAGIGVTPFASILESIALRAGRGDLGPDKVYFYWLNRDAYSFEWFAELLLNLERVDTKRLVDVRIFMTDGKGHLTAAVLNLARAMAHGRGRPDLITGLRSKTNVGRPDFRGELGRIQEAHPGAEVDVFFCGPPGLGKSILAACRELGLTYRQEHF